jgi:ATP-binding cassette subfamily B (MDR/TAP) protein 1
MNKTTIVITHELSQIEPQDFVYVLKGGTVVEQGFRGDLEEVMDQELEEGGRGEFRRMMASQGQAPRSVPTVEETESEDEEEEEKPIAQIPPSLKHQSLALRPLTFGNLNWMFDAVAELTRPSTLSPPPPNSNLNGLSVPELAYHPSKKRDTLTTRLSRLAFPFASQTQLQTQPIRPPLPAIAPLHLQPQKNRRPSSALFPNTPLTIDTFTSDVSRKSRRFSAPGQTPTSATFTVVDREWEDVDLKGSAESKDYDDMWWDRESEREEEEEFEKDKKAIARSGSVVHEKRKKMCRGERSAMNIKVESKEDEGTNEKANSTNPQRPPSFFRTSRQTLPTIPSKPLFVFGLALATLSGLMTPVFSYLLSRLLFEVSLGGTNTKVINQFGGILLVICACDGLFLGGKYVLMEIVSMQWVTSVRERALARVLAQDRAWFDGYSPCAADENTTTAHSHTTQSLIQTLIKDGDDARALISVVYGQTFVVLTMLSTGLIWALILGWQLTLAGLAIAPVFALVMALQSRFSSLAEARNKAARDGMGAAYYDALKHVFAVRALGGSGFRTAYARVFEGRVEGAMRAGVKGAFVEGTGFGVASGMIYFAEAGLFYVGAVLMQKGVFGYLRMVEVLNLVVFSVSIGAQLMAFSEFLSSFLLSFVDVDDLLQLRK